MTNTYDTFEAFETGQRYTYQHSHPWSGKRGKERGVETVTTVIRITAVYPTRFEYTVDEVLSIDNPLPGTAGLRVINGGMENSYAATLLIDGKLVPYDEA